MDQSDFSSLLTIVHHLARQDEIRLRSVGASFPGFWKVPRDPNIGATNYTRKQAAEWLRTNLDASVLQSVELNWHLSELSAQFPNTVNEFSEGLDLIKEEQNRRAARLSQQQHDSLHEEIKCSFREVCP